MWGRITGIAKIPTTENIAILNNVDLFSNMPVYLNTTKMGLSQI